MENGWTAPPGKKSISNETEHIKTNEKRTCTFSPQAKTRPELIIMSIFKNKDALFTLLPHPPPNNFAFFIKKIERNSAQLSYYRHR